MTDRSFMASVLWRGRVRRAAAHEAPPRGLGRPVAPGVTDLGVVGLALRAECLEAFGIGHQRCDGLGGRPLAARSEQQDAGGSDEESLHGGLLSSRRN